MKPVKILSVLAVFLFLVTPLANAKENLFTGLWEGIDEDDGSAMVISIKKIDKGEFEILWRETHFHSCAEGEWGIIRGKASIKDGDLAIYAELLCNGLWVNWVQPVLSLSHKGAVLATSNGSLTLHRISSRK